MGYRQGAIALEDVAAFAYRSHHVIYLSVRLLRCEVFYVVVGIVEGWTYEVCHAGIDDGKLFVGALLDVERLGDE